MNEVLETSGTGTKVVLLYNLLERLEKGEDKDLVAEAAVIEEIEPVESAIRSLGHQCYVMGVKDEVYTIFHWLQEIGPDVVFNLCESVYDDTCMEMNIPALLDLMHIPYTGSPPLTLGLCQDKAKVKGILLSQGVHTPRYQVFNRLPKGPRGVHLSFPSIVKPVHEDGSLGITRDSVVYEMGGLERQIRYVLEVYRQPALVEEYIDGREINVGMIELNGKLEALPISEIDYSEFPPGMAKICGYDAKWDPKSIEYQRSKPVCPAPVEPGLKRTLESVAMQVYRLFECRDYARVDLRVDHGGRPYVIEVNPNPDISPESGMARAIKAYGMTYDQFIQGVVEKALQRKPR
jgi:D-alanine-D-alanine ligase